MHFIVFLMHSDVLHSTNRLHSNAFYNHFELLHSSDARRLHSDAFSYLLHSGHVTFWCILMHPKGPLHVDAFATWRIHGVTHFNAFWCSCNSCILLHSESGAFICIIVHSQCVAFYTSCIQMHLYASPHKLHSVDTLHSDALAFLRIHAHSNAYIHTRIRLHSHVYALGDGEESDEDLDDM